MANDGGKLKKFLDWVNADENLPSLDELGHGHSGHDDDGHDDHGHDNHGHDDHGHDEHGHDGHDHDDHGHDEHQHGGHGHNVENKPTVQEEDDREDEELSYPDVVASRKEAVGEGPSPARNAAFPAPHREHAIPMSEEQKGRLKNFHFLYGILSVVLTVGIILVLLVSVVYLPGFGDEHNPTINEVYTRYVEKGTEETGALNIVAAMILDYRAFDTLGESIMLFTATMGVVMLIRTTGDSSPSGEPRKEEK